MTFAPCSSKLITAAILNEKNKKRNKKRKKTRNKGDYISLVFLCIISSARPSRAADKPKARDAIDEGSMVQRESTNGEVREEENFKLSAARDRVIGIGSRVPCLHTPPRLTTFKWIVICKLLWTS